MNLEHILLTTISTLFGLYKWTVILIGLYNVLATQQQRVTRVLRHLIGKICHVYLDNIIIWLESKAEHIANIRKVMQALYNKGLICLLKKTKLFCTEVKFLEHLITVKGTEADPDKVKHILEWPQPQRAKDVCKFLRLLCYIVIYLLHLAEHTTVLSLFTSKDCDKVFLE